MMRFQAEPFERWHGEAAQLFREHWELVGRHKELVPLEVDVERWVRASASASSRRSPRARSGASTAMRSTSPRRA
jgi:hypothetical protein